MIDIEVLGKAKVEVPFKLHTASEPEGAIYSRKPLDLIRDYQQYVLGSSLQKRALVLQETLLSHRIIHFSSKQPYWECRATFGAEDNFIKEADYRERAHDFLDTLSLL